ncbi:MAG: Tellurite resistance protein [Candidatus Accumulibacter sp. BA-94]|nr:MAG: Tellurite resistance protein [Candidatus Accumulibacter sp. BA-94]
MFPLFANASLATDQTIAATRLMLHIAHVDGAQTAEEVALIRSFCEGAGDGATWPDFASLQPVRAGEFSQTFGEPAQRDLVVAFCLMVAYADGTLSADELSAVAAVAAGIGMPPARVGHAAGARRRIAGAGQGPHAGAVRPPARRGFGGDGGARARLKAGRRPRHRVGSLAPRTALVPDPGATTARPRSA